MRNQLLFTKMHGIGNDYIYFDCTRGEESSGIPECILNDDKSLNRLSVLLSDRHKGIGADGIILILPSKSADFKMRIFNADGSEAKMCGNGTRCVGKFVYDHQLTRKQIVALQTKSGIKMLDLHIGSDNKVESVKVDMSCAETRPDLIPVVIASNQDNGWNIRVDVNDKEYCVNAVSMGNPHGVVFVDVITDEMVHKDGPLLENHSMWPDRANIEFAKCDDAHNVTMRVWERGSGETMACGTGACATAVAAVATGLCEWPVRVHLLGGTLTIDKDIHTGHILMEGPATEVFHGEMTLPEI